MGLLYLEEGHAARGPRLREAVRAFPNVGFLTMYLADAAVQCGDLGEARRLLDQARALPRNDPLNGLTRVEADLAAAEGRHGDAERLYRQAMVNNYIAKFRLAQLLESTGRLEEAIAQYREVCDAMPYAAKPREALAAAMKAAQRGP
jgi:tetratricopeptide (TPR) repeat protein